MCRFPFSKKERMNAVTKKDALNEKPYAGNPHVRSDEGKNASVATSRRGSLLYRRFLAIAVCVSSMGLYSETIVYSTSTIERLKGGQAIMGNVDVQINEGQTGGGIVELYPYSTYTGCTYLKCGTLSVPTFGMRGMPDAMGVGNPAGDSLVLGAGTLHYTGSDSESDRGVLIDTGSDTGPCLRM